MNAIIPSKQRTSSPSVGFEDGDMLVDCAGCDGPSNLGEKRCFNCISKVMLPGFKGSVVLKGYIDRRYRGPISELLQEHSDILRTIRSLGSGSREKDILMGLRLKGTSKRMERTFLDDVGRFQKAKDRTLAPLSRSNRTRRAHHLAGEIFSRGALLRKRMERELSNI